MAMRNTVFHWRILLGLATLIVVGILSLTGIVHWALACVYAGMSVLSIVMYGWDKRQAIRNQWRTAERTLLGIDLLCGWPGGLIAQHLWKHKRSKGAYLLLFWLAVILNTTALGLMIYYLHFAGSA